MSCKTARNIFFEQNKITEEEVIGWISSDERQNENVLEINGRHYETRISEIKQSEKNNMIQGYMVWIFDMTFLDRYTNEMIRLKEESEQANKAKTNFLAHMSHEIRTPMNSIVGYSELALIGKDELLIHGYLKHIKDSAHTLLRLINEMLDISKIESGKMEMVNVQYSLSKLVNEIRYMMEAQAGKVEDTGIGIKEENFSKVFGKFEQFDKKENYNIEGTGLGLAIVKSFVEMMGGDISFVSEYGKGTKFMVNLWQEIGEKEKTESAVYEENSANGVPEINPGRILVVDDNKLNCDVTQGILELLGMDTQITYSGADCIKKLEDGENYDLIFMDHMMPEMDGVETLDRIRNMGEEFKTLPVVLLTANAVSGIKEQMIDRGFDDYLSKPIDVDELQHVLVRFLGCKG